jgi:DNA-binding GntR family transcriptional regulator
LDELAAATTWDLWVQGNLAFHGKLYEAASSRRLVALIKGLQDTTAAFVSSTLRAAPDLRAKATREHREMLEAARSHDEERLVEITLRHLAIPVGEAT